MTGDSSGARARYQAQISAQQFELSLVLRATQPPLLNGVGGYSRKGPDPQSASYYYSEPHLQCPVASDARAARTWCTARRGSITSGRASTSTLPRAAGTGSESISTMAARSWRFASATAMARPAGPAATVDAPAQGPQSFGPAQVQFRALRHWRSPHSGIDYPVTWQLRVGDRTLTLEPLLDDQEFDARLSSGALYWEGAVRVVGGRRDRSDAAISSSPATTARCRCVSRPPWHAH